MRRGTRVGQAYVALTADGSGINDDIADAFDDVDYKGLADDFDKKFADRIRGHLNRVDGDFTKSLNSMGKRAAENSAISDGISKKLAEAFDQGKLDELFQRVGREAGVTVGSEFDKVVKPAVLNAVESAMLKAARTGRQIDLFGAVSEEAAESIRRTIETGQREFEKAQRENSALAKKFAERRVQMHEKSNEAIFKSDAELAKTQEALYAKLEREHFAQQKKDDDDLWKIRRASAKAHAKFLADLEKGRVDQRGVDVSRNKETDLGVTVGRLFGAGSRNNFLNLFGKSLGGIVTLTQKVAAGAQSMFSVFSKGFSEAAEGASFFQKIGSGAGASGTQISTFFSSIAASGPAAAVAIGAVAIAMALLVSVAGALVGVLTALIATLSGALVAALAVASGGMLALVAAGGLLTAAFMSMTDAQSKLLKNAFQPLRAEMVGIGQLMIKEMVPAFAVWSKNLQEALLLLAPVAQVMGKAFAESGKILTESLSGPGFQKLSVALGQELPAIVQNLSRAFGGFLNGTMGLFAAIMPLVTRFSAYLSALAARFSAWANSTTGQNTIVSFVDRAVGSLMSLWNFVREFIGFISDVLFSPSAMNAGNGFFDSLARSFARFRANITQAKLEKWFADARMFAGALKEGIKALAAMFVAFYNSGVLKAMSTNIKDFSRFVRAAAPVVALLVDALGFLAPAFRLLLIPINLVSLALETVGNWVTWALERLRALGSYDANIPFVDSLNALIRVLNAVRDAAMDAFNRVKDTLGLGGGKFAGTIRGNGSGGKTVGPTPIITAADPPLPSLSDLIGSGNSSIAGTSSGGGGGGGGAGGGQFKNPYKAWAESLIKQGPSISKQIQDAIKKVNADIRKGITAATKAESALSAQQGLNSLMVSVRDIGKSTVDAARQALNSAAQDLAGASSMKDAKAALRRVRAAQADMRKALNAQKKINAAAAILGKQKIVRDNVVDRLVRGGSTQNATLAEFAAARQQVAAKLEAANQKLADAIALRRDYRKSVMDAVSSFGSLLTAQARTVDGVEQALTAGDITSNLQARLDKIKKFQEDLRQLIALGLSNDAYKQLVDAGVEQGGQFASALLGGGLSAIAETNSLVSQINATADGLGTEAASRMYQAGVDAAQGLVDGLESLSAQLDSAATRLGNAIANAVKRALGISSPSRVLRGLMGDVGDGMVLGLNDQTVKVGSAASHLAGQIAVSPEVAAYAARQGTSATTEEAGVSGNHPDPRFRDLIVNTPTENPEAVAMEVLNEITGRL